jgi:hypothetical protein
MVCLLSPVSISLQYGETSSYNEIEHSETIPFTELNEEIKHKLKICQDLFQFDLGLEKLFLKISSEIFDDLKNQVNLSISTPPPEFV